MNIWKTGSEKLLNKKNLEELEKKRLAFALDSLTRQYYPQKALYVQRDGGFTGIGINNKALYIITGPAPGYDEHYHIQPYQCYDARLEPIYQQIKGMGGLFGFGDKGGKGWRLVIKLLPSKGIELNIIPCLTCFWDVILEDDHLFSTRESKKNNIFRYMRPQSYSACYMVLAKWLDLLREIYTESK